jgi:hypothetical protein
MDRSPITDKMRDISLDSPVESAIKRDVIHTEQGLSVLKSDESLPASGFGIIFAQNDQGIFYVHSLVPGSPASLSQPEIRVGDVLCSINAVSVYKHDLHFVARCMAGSMKEKTVFGFSCTGFPTSGQRTNKTVVLSRQLARKEPGIEGPLRASVSPDTSSAAKATGFVSNSPLTSDQESLQNSNECTSTLDTSADEEFSLANKLRDQGSYADAIKLYRKILGDFATNHQRSARLHPAKGQGASCCAEMEKENLTGI